MHRGYSFLFIVVDLFYQKRIASYFFIQFSYKKVTLTLKKKFNRYLKEKGIQEDNRIERVGGKGY